MNASDARKYSMQNISDHAAVAVTLGMETSMGGRKEGRKYAAWTTEEDAPRTEGSSPGGFARLSRDREQRPWAGGLLPGGRAVKMRVGFSSGLEQRHRRGPSGEQAGSPGGGGGAVYLKPGGGQELGHTSAEEARIQVRLAGGVGVVLEALHATP